jgi:MATE family multidrug resistance protein
MTDCSALTRHPVGSVRELWEISFPLMISTFASLLMIFTDRIFLAHYSVGALNASVNAGTLAWAFMSGFAMVTAMSEVFVAQYNGAKLYHRIGVPVWQMIWFSFLSLLVFVPVAIWGAPLIFQNDPYADLEIGYFRWLMLFSPSYALLTAFAGFLIGRGKTRIMIWLAIIANLINILLDWALIYGVPGWIPELGINGAAMATCFGYLFESVVLACIFLSKENRAHFGTGQWRLNKEEMIKCIKIGLPQGIFSALEIFGWAVFFWMMTTLSEKHITISSICQTVTVLLSFFSDGLSRGSAAVAGNCIGSRQHGLVGKVLTSGILLLFIFTALVSIFLVIDPVDTARFLFFSHAEASQALDGEIAQSLQLCMIFSFIYLFFDGIRWLLGGLLVAAGDTRFLLFFGSISVWVFLLAPVYFIVVKQSANVEIAWLLTVLYAALFFLAYYVRFKRGKWRKIDLISTDAPLKPVENSVHSIR